MPCTPRDSNSMSHTALRCRCRPSGPGGTCWVQAGSGCLAARVTRSRGGSVWASPNSSRDGWGTTTSRAIFLCLQKRHFWASAPASAPYVSP